MSGNVVGSLLLEVTANVGRITSDLGKISRQVDKFSGDITKTLGVLGKAFGSVFTLGTIAAFGREALDFGESISKASKKFGIGAEQLSAMRYAAELADVSFEDLGVSLKKLSVNAVDATKGSGDAAEAFNAMGISVTDATGKVKPLDRLLGEVADKFKNYEDGAEKVALATALMGKNAANLIPLLNEGSAGIAKMTEEAKKAGVVISDETAAKMEEFNDNLKRIKENALGAAVAITNGLMKAIDGLMNTLRQSGGAAAFDAVVLQGFGGFGGGASGGKGAGGSWDVAGKAVAPNLKKGTAKAGKDQFTGIPDKDEWQLSLELITSRYDALQNSINLTEEAAAAASLQGIQSFEWAEKARQGGEEFRFFNQERQQMADLMKDFGDDFEPVLSMQEQFNLAWEGGNYETAIRLLNEGLLQTGQIMDQNRAKIENFKYIMGDTARFSASVFGSLANTFEQFYRAQGSKNKALFRLMQAMRIGEAIMNTYAGAARALAEFPWPYSLIVSGIVIASGLANVATIASQKPGSAHGGLTTVPKEETYLLDAGERVLSPTQNEDLTTFLQDNNSGRGQTIQLILDGSVLAEWFHTSQRNGTLQLRMA